MSDQIKNDRRRFFGTAVMTIAVAQLGMFVSADAQPSKPALLVKIDNGSSE